jgi:hypothetical protein
VGSPVKRSLIISTTDFKKIPGVHTSGSKKGVQSSWALIRSGNKKQTETKHQSQVLRVHGGKRGKKGKSGPSLPPRLKTTVMVHHVYRFSNSTVDAAVAITGGMLAGAIGGICTVTNSKVRAWATSARVHKITVWPGLASTNESCEIYWRSPISGIQKDDVNERSLPGGVTIDRALVSRPPKGTLCADWMDLNVLGSATLWSFINLPDESVIDLEVSYTMTNVMIAQDLTVTTGVLAAAYYLPLDGPALHLLTAIGVPTTF